ncbi:hypothetical protein [Cerasicoccus arenae]|uniref:Uncharacterized protein n=1 Tax=Cerasicoccus arenae TaxID=424488 RepID=A0A8J3DA21_9BACT|nr:hypothetical protein [Cerasicoccus arenae]MBK1859745.1 hypothetical protein [Cerasicoccus arenae]GHB93564.1 hypothetical protein GCM10007047_06310 [Cerasicoccus arenae]
MSIAIQIVLGLLIFSLGISYANSHFQSPLLFILNRWLRWLLFAFTISAAAREFELSERPFWVLAGVAFLGWFLFETLYNWLKVCAVSRGPIPLFPRFRQNFEGDEWPADKRFILLRDWLRSTGFKKLESLKADLISDYVIRSSIYQDEQGLVRLQVIFFPQGVSSHEVNYVLITKTQEGERVITSNLNMPFGGYYPDKWFIVRKPLMRSLDKLLRFHRRRLLREGVNVQVWEDDAPLDDLNRQQTNLEIANMESGYLLKREFQEEHGRLSFEGRYRLWKEHWLISYLGRTVQY